MTVKMWPNYNDWTVSSSHISAIATLYCAILFGVCVLCALIVYRCYIMPQKKKEYSLRLYRDNNISSPSFYPNVLIYNNEIPPYTNSTAHLCKYREQAQPMPKPKYPRTASTLQYHQCQNSHITPVCKSCSNPKLDASANSDQHLITQTTGRLRPLSQPGRLQRDEHINSATSIITRDQLSEFSPHAQYASAFILDDPVDGNFYENEHFEEAVLKTRSLPACVRSKTRPLATEECLNDLYTRVNFSKKKRNRMRNDEAAIIALSKSHTQFLDKDTDLLVDNEAIIVYNERTAL